MGDFKYYQIEGQNYERVSTILSYMENINDSKHYVNWKKRVGIEKATALKILGSRRGTIMHTTVEHIVKGEVDKAQRELNKLAKEDRVRLQYLKPFLRTFLFEQLELRVHYKSECEKLKYAGSIDYVGYIPEDKFLNSVGEPVGGFRCIADLKNFSKRKDKKQFLLKTFLQMAAYSIAYNQRHPNEPDINNGLIVATSPKGVNYHLISEDIMDFYRESFLEGLICFQEREKFDWNSFIEKAGHTRIEVMDNIIFKEKTANHKLPEEVHLPIT